MRNDIARPIGTHIARVNRPLFMMTYFHSWSSVFVIRPQVRLCLWRPTDELVCAQFKNHTIASANSDLVIAGRTAQVQPFPLQVQQCPVVTKIVTSPHLTYPLLAQWPIRPKCISSSSLCQLLHVWHRSSSSTAVRVFHFQQLTATLSYGDHCMYAS